jgi:hypothetical protein
MLFGKKGMAQSKVGSMRQALRMYLKRNLPPEMRQYYSDLERGLARGECDQGLRCVKTAPTGACIKWVLDATCPQLHWSQHPLRCGSGAHEGQTCVASKGDAPTECIGWAPEPLCPTHVRTLLAQDGKLAHLRTKLHRTLKDYRALRATGRNVHVKDGGPCPDNLKELNTLECQLGRMGQIDACIAQRSQLNRKFELLLHKLQQIEVELKGRIQDLQLQHGLPLEQQLYAEVFRELELPRKVQAHTGHVQAEQEMERYRVHCHRALSPVPFDI